MGRRIMIIILILILLISIIIIMIASPIDVPLLDVLNDIIDLFLSRANHVLVFIGTPH